MHSRHPAAGWTWRVFATCWLVYTALWTPYIVREHYLAIALVERGSMNLERYLGWSDDIFRGPRGGAYINNNPGASLTAAAALLPFRPLLVRVDEWNQKLPRRATPQGDNDMFWRMLAEGRAFYFLLCAFLTVALVMAPATAGTAAYLCARLADAGVAAGHAALAALLFGLGTPVMFRAEHLNHNLLVCDAGFLALLLLWDPQNAPLRPARAAGAGLLAGYCFLCDYSGAVVIAATGLYVWLRCAGLGLLQRGKVLAAFGAGVLPGIAGLAIYLAWAFGAPLPSQHYMPATAPTSKGYRGIDWPSPALVWANFFDPRFGLFAYCPALLLAFTAPFVRRVRHRVPRRETLVIFGYFLLFVTFCAANQYSWLQPLTGFRYLVPVVPGLAVLSIQAAQALPRPARWAVAAASCGQTFLMAASYQNNLPQAVRVLWRRGFELPWMIRLGQAGVGISWVWPLMVFLLLGAGVVAIWAVPRRTTRQFSEKPGFRYGH
jgi:hypothetical protein